MKYNVYRRLFIIVLLRNALALYLNYHFVKTPTRYERKNIEVCRKHNLLVKTIK